jgi:O-antigen ligase
VFKISIFLLIIIFFVTHVEVDCLSIFISNISLLSILFILLLLISGIFMIFSKWNLSISVQSAVILLFCLTILGEFWLIFKEFKFVLLLVFSIWIYLLVSILPKISLRYVIYALLSGTFVEVVFGYLQLFKVIENGNPFFYITGSMGNPAPFASYIATCIPFAFYSSLKTEGENRIMGYLGLTVLILSVAIIPQTQSRSAIVATTIGMLFLLDQKYHWYRQVRNYLKSKGLLTIVMIVSPIVLGKLLHWLYLVKLDSAQGRLLVWKGTLSLIRDNFWTGVGYGNFPKSYATYQANYFGSGKGTPREKFLADYVTTAYNDILELTAETGIIGCGLFVYFLWLSVKHIRSVVISKEEEGFRQATLASLLIMGVLSLTTYTLSVFPIQMNLFFLLGYYNSIDASATKSSAISLGPWFAKLFAVGLLGFVSWLAYFQYRNYQALVVLREGAILESQYKSVEAIAKYESVYPVFRHDGGYLFKYAYILAQQKTYARSNKLLSQAKAITGSYNSYTLLGENHYKMKQYGKAEENLLYSSNLIPSKFYCKHLLLRVYMDSGQYKKAKILQNEMMKMPVKVPSLAVNEMISNTRLIGKQLQSL